jgi:hypothetical protein
MQHLEGSGTPVLYIGRTVLKVLCSAFLLCSNLSANVLYAETVRLQTTVRAKYATESFDVGYCYLC